MENLKFSVFDIFAYLLPGTVLLAALVVISTPEIKNLADYIEMSREITLGLGIVAIIFSYLLGNVTDNFGSWLYYKIGCKIWGEPYPKVRHPRLSHAQQRALIRQYSLENFSVLQTWKVLKTMSHNLAFAVLFFTVISIIKYVQYRSLDWIIVFCASIISAVVFLNRASVYDKWHYNQMLETVEVLELEKREKLDLSKKKEDSKTPSKK